MSVVGDAGTPEPASLRDECAAAAQEAMLVYWENGDIDHWTEVEEGQVAADAVLAVPGVAAALRIAAAVEAEPKLVSHCLQPEWLEGENRGHNMLLRRLRAVGKDTDQPAIRAEGNSQ